MISHSKKSYAGSTATPSSIYELYIIRPKSVRTFFYIIKKKKLIILYKYQEVIIYAERNGSVRNPRFTHKESFIFHFYEAHLCQIVVNLAILSLPFQIFTLYQTLDPFLNVLRRWYKF